MATIMDLFKDKKSEIYGLSAETYIESRGLINPPRQAALLASSPNAVADLIGSAAGALVKGNANRPSDTIFKDNKPITKPISVIPTLAQLKNAIEPNTAYFVKREPSPGANIANFIKNAVQSPQSLQSAGINLLNNLGSKKISKDYQNYYKRLKGIKELHSPGMAYGTKYSLGPDGKPRSEDKKYSDSAPVYHKTTDENGHLVYRIKNVEDRKRNTRSTKEFGSQWDLINSRILAASSYNTEDEYATQVKQIEKDNQTLQATYVKFEMYGENYSKLQKNIILPGTISGISEDFAPEWNTFKYIGSPFNLYRYGGVERTLKFDIKLYYTDDETKKSMILNLNKLRKIVYPNDNIGVVTYPNSANSTQLYFTPNLVYLTINGLYERLLGIVDTLSFSIDDNTSWGTTNPDFFNGNTTKPYPTVINVSIGMKVIENPDIKDNKFQYDRADFKYTNYFTGIDQEGNTDPGKVLTNDEINASANSGPVTPQGPTMQAPPQSNNLLFGNVPSL